MELKTTKDGEKESHHLWGILNYKASKNFYSTWDYIRPCTADRRALIGINTRRYRELEVRKSDGGTAVRFLLKDGVVE